MNFKKFISGVSAFAIAASAFAGMAVTASAAPVEPLDWKVIANETDPETGDEIVTPWSGNATLGTSGDLVTFTAGNASGNRAGTYEFDSTQTYTAGVVNVSYTINLSSNNGTSQRSVATFDLQGSGKSIVKVESTTWLPEGEAGKTSGAWTAYNVISGDNTDPITINADNTYTFNISVNLDEHKVSYTVSGNGQNVSRTDVAIDNSIANVNKLYIQAPRGGALVKLGAFTVENILSPAGAVTLQYKVGDTEIATATTLSVSGMASGQQLTYAYPKYIADGGNLYKTTADKTRATVNLTAAAQTVKATYAVEAEGEYYVYEKDGGYTTRADYESNGSAATQNATVTVPADGKYIVTANCYGSAANRNATVKVGDTVLVPTTTISIYAPGTDLVSEEVELKKDDVITVSCGNSKDGIDYVILQRTGDLPSAQPYSKGFEFTAKIDDVKAKHLYVTATINDEKKMSDRGTVESLLPTNFTDTTANLTVFLSNIPASYKNVGVVIDWEVE